MTSTADVVIFGAGIAGLAAAYYLAVHSGIRDVVIIDERAPLSLTSDKSSECYRNWWPGPGSAMVGLMNRSIDLLESLAFETGNAIRLNRRGYLYATADPTRIATFAAAAEEAAALGAGPVRYHSGQGGDPAYAPAPAEDFVDQPTGADVITYAPLIRQHFPYLSEATVAVVHARRCGWFSAQQLGMIMLEEARARGVRLVQARVEQVEVAGGRVAAVQARGPTGVQRWPTRTFVNAAGPFLAPVSRLLSIDLPVFAERHLKIGFNDHLGIMPRHAPLLIWADPQHVAWDDEARAWFGESDDTRWLLGEFPAGVHGRPDGPADSPVVLMLWPYHNQPVEVVFPVPSDPEYPDVVLRGMATMLPGLHAYFARAPKPYIDGGYYLKTRENRPLIGPLPVSGAYVLGALSGFGLMAAPGAGEVLAAHIAGTTLPDYASHFALARYDDPAYRTLLDNWGDVGQL